MAAFAARDDLGVARAPFRPGHGVARPEPLVRDASREDLDAIAALFEPALEPYRGSGADWIVDAYLADLLDVRSRFDTAETYVATLAGRIVGSVAFYPDVALEGWSNLPRGWAGFRALAVLPDARGAGVGRALVEHCLRRGRDVGAPTLGIHTIDLLADAVRLYERVGFVRCPEFDLRAADVFPSDVEGDMIGIAFRCELTADAIEATARPSVGS
jgi:GNAT superfamily N-acetyltransferase